MEPVSNIINGYKKAFARYGESPKALQWLSYHSAAIRFRELVKNLDLENKTILDAGCGMGDLLPFIYCQAVNFSYLGMDINKDFIEVARKRYAGHSFEVGDPFDPDFHEEFDIVLCSGVMNHNQPGWLEDRKDMIKKLYSLADEALAFNMAGSLEPPPPSGRVAYANAAEIADFCRTLSSKVELFTNYHPDDFTIIVRR